MIDRFINRVSGLLFTRWQSQEPWILLQVRMNLEGPCQTTLATISKHILSLFNCPGYMQCWYVKRWEVMWKMKWFRFHSDFWITFRYFLGNCMTEIVSSKLGLQQDAANCICISFHLPPFREASMSTLSSTPSACRFSRSDLTFWRRESSSATLSESFASKKSSSVFFYYPRLEIKKVQVIIINQWCLIISQNHIVKKSWRNNIHFLDIYYLCCYSTL